MTGFLLIGLVCCLLNIVFMFVYEGKQEIQIIGAIGWLAAAMFAISLILSDT